MKVNIISRLSFTLTDILTVSEYKLSTDSEYSGKSQFVLHRKPVAEEDDFIILMDDGVQFQGIISSIENKKGQNSYTVTAIEMPRLFDQKVVLANEPLLATGIEDFIAAEITGNWISNADDIVNIDYLTVTAKTHTPIAAAVDAEEGGVYNLCTYIGNAMTKYGIFLTFEFTASALNIVIEKKTQSTLQIDTGIADIMNLSEVHSVQALAKLTVLWYQGSEATTATVKNFFLSTDRTITQTMTDPDRAKGTVDVMVSKAETEAAMIQEVQDKFTGNSYNHKITFDFLITSKLISESEMYVGHSCKVKTKNGIKDSIITAINKSNESNSINVTLGQMKVTLIEKLKGVELK